MKFTYYLEYARNILIAFYRWLIKLSINAHQVYAFWKTKLRSSNSERYTTSTNVELTDQNRASNNLRQPQTSSLGSQQQYNSAATTPNSRRSKLSSIFRSLSLRNFMEYCVIALNEASSSGCSNKFDLSSCDKPVWLLGRKYVLPQDADKLIDDTRSKLWITYRRNFPSIDDNTRYTTDRGFGCMIRCGQMVLANALLCKNLGRDWRWSASGLESNPQVYSKVLKLFQDKEECPYSIHNIVRAGLFEGKTIGEWFGPNTIAQTLKRISTNLSNSDSDNEEVLISVDAALDNVVVIEEIKSRFKQEAHIGDKEEVHDSTTWLPGILFIQLRLGLTKINPLYFSALKKTFEFDNSLGIIGGRPNHALYLIGHTEDDIIYLDPHSTQQFIDIDVHSSESQTPDDIRPTIAQAPIDGSYHCTCPEKMPLDKLDPSLALCFYFHSEKDFDTWCEQSQNLLIKSEQAPMFEITASRPTGWNIQLNSTTVRSTFNLTDDSFDMQDNTNRSLSPKSPPKKTGSFSAASDSATSGDQVGRSKKPEDSTRSNDDEEFELLG